MYPERERCHSILILTKAEPYASIKADSCLLDKSKIDSPDTSSNRLLFSTTSLPISPVCSTCGPPQSSLDIQSFLDLYQWCTQRLDPDIFNEKCQCSLRQGSFFGHFLSDNWQIISDPLIDLIENGLNRCDHPALPAECNQTATAGR